MSTSSMKLLSIRARNSITSLSMFCNKDGSANEIQCPTTPRNSENATPGVEELGLSPSHQKSRCSAAYQSSPISPAKESPSKRKKLIGSLRSMTYLRSVQTPSPKAKNEKIRELHSESVTPRTSIREIRPSLTLNFEESPPDKPMFDEIQRKISSSASTFVHHSSPIPIPTISKPTNTFCSENTVPCCLPGGTVPTSPAPIQLLLRNDKIHVGGLEPTSMTMGMEELADAVPTPLPGTNLIFDDEGLAPPAISAGEGQGYFDLDRGSSAQGVAENRSRNLVCGATARLGTEEHEDTALGTVTNQDGLYLQKPRKRSATGHCGELQSQEPDLNLEEFDHVLYATNHAFDLASDESTPQSRPFDTSAASLSGFRSCGLPQIKTDGGPQMQTHAQVEMHEHYSPRHSESHWGTHGSLYNGAGYGEETDSSSMHQSSPSTTERQSFESQGALCYTKQPCSLIVEEHLVPAPYARIQDLDAISRDHETLEEVIRAYAMYEEEGASDLRDDFFEDVKEKGVGECQTNLKPAERRADGGLEA